MGDLAVQHIPHTKTTATWVRVLLACLCVGLGVAARSAHAEPTQAYGQMQGQGPIPKASGEVKSLIAKAQCASDEGRKDEAVSLYKKALEERAAVVGQDSVELGSLRQALYTVLKDDPAQAIPYIKACIAAYDNAAKGGMPDNAVRGGLMGPYRDLALALHKQGKLKEAKAAARQALLYAQGVHMPGAGSVVPNAASASNLMFEIGNAPLHRMLGEAVAGEMVNVFLLEAELAAEVQDGDVPAAMATLDLFAGALDGATTAFTPMGGDYQSLPTILAAAESSSIALMQRVGLPEQLALGLFVSAARQGRTFDMAAAMCDPATDSRVPAKVAQARLGRSRRAALYLKGLRADADRSKACGEGGAQNRDYALERAQHELEVDAYCRAQIENGFEAIWEKGLKTISGTSRKVMKHAPYQELTASVQSVLGPSDALINFVYTSPVEEQPGALERTANPPRYYAYVVRAIGDVQLKDLGVAAPIDSAVQVLRDDIETASADSVERSAAQLGQQVLAPLANALAGASHLYVVTDGRLQYAPFDALKVDGVTAIDRYRFTYVSSARSLVTTARAQQAEHTSRPFSAVTFEVPRVEMADVSWFVNEELAELKGVTLETKAIRDMLTGSAVQSYAGAEADEKAFLDLAAPTILHFGGHAIFVPKGYRAVAPSTESQRGFAVKAEASPVTGKPRAMLSSDVPLMHTALLVAPPQAGESDAFDNVVTSYEIARMELRGTELVVLGACDTATGMDMPTQGIGSLRRAFMMAGAKTVLATLWPVSDASTKEFMTQLYGRLLKGEGRSIALHEAKKAIRKRYPDARHWAAFTLSGATGPLPTLPSSATVQR